jgi:hypothetical protein
MQDNFVCVNEAENMTESTDMEGNLDNSGMHLNPSLRVEAMVKGVEGSIHQMSGGIDQVCETLSGTNGHVERPLVMIGEKNMIGALVMGGSLDNSDLNLSPSLTKEEVGTGMEDNSHQEDGGSGHDEVNANREGQSQSWVEMCEQLNDYTTEVNSLNNETKSSEAEGGGEGSGNRWISYPTSSRKRF